MRRTGDVQPRRVGGDKRSGRIEAHAGVILAAVEKKPDITLLLYRRQAWFEAQLDPDPTRLIFIDEMGTSTKMARLHGRAPRG